jgi:hypothetical protein
MIKYYLEDMNPDEIPNGYHVARWHGNGKLFISVYELSFEEAMIEVAEANRSGIARTPYFVWMPSLSPEIMALFKIEKHLEPL